ncbi:GNAT family N-acetyltransferase [Nocardiopsis sp. LOL_012]|uniref:GNAT family N-acetyltransferase n=1 Tax=Nocardiopsis sp. LOL_012 TaxID=3345409 RepID=UPI003A86C7E6
MANDPGPEQAAAVWTVRGIEPDELPDLVAVVGEALLSSDDPRERADRFRPVVEAAGYDRFLVAVEGDRIVGTAGSFDFEMAMPGGPRPVAGVTVVGVWPTYRRRGVLTAMMRHQLRDLHRRGEPLAALWASEGGIYGRFGYGAASVETHLTVPHPAAVLRPDAPRDPALRTFLGDPGEVRQEIARVFDAAVADRPGRYRRDGHWWDRVLDDRPETRGGSGPLRAVVVSGGDGPRGYALYRIKGEPTLTGWESELRVQELVASDPAARVALYEHVFARDLVARIAFEHTAVDDPLWSLLADRQRIHAAPGTALWVRLVDVPAALAERSYAAPVDTVVEVTDRHAPWNAGRWHVRADGGGASVEATGAAPDLALDASHLGAAFLGQHTLAAHAAAGLVDERTPGAAASLDTALRVPHAPLCGTIF